MDKVKVICSNCGVERQHEWASISERPPCPRCGATTLTQAVSTVLGVHLTADTRTELIPINQHRDWKQSWKALEEEIQSISTPRTEECRSDSIHPLSDQLGDFFTRAYHLKDKLKFAARNHALGIGLAEKDIEGAINNDPRLALLADLANTEKHVELDRPPRSGNKPVLMTRSLIDSPSGNGWIMSYKIKHANSVLDGITVACDAMTAWQETFKKWGLNPN